MCSIVSVKWLNQNINDENIIVLDASPKTNISGLSSEYEGKRIPNARYFSIKENFTAKNSLFPNTIPTKTQFETEAQKLGINKDSKIVVYDNLGIYASPRVWWLFQVFGHENIAVLDGGLPLWVQEGFPTEEIKQETYKAGNFKARFNSSYLKLYEHILANVEHKQFTIVDARSAGRFNGLKPEPRKNLQSGSIPNSVNLPFQDVLEDGKFKSKEALEQLFDSLVTKDTELVFSCGSGLTASILMLAAKLAGKKDLTVYDGSWTEWAEKQKLYTS